MTRLCASFPFRLRGAARSRGARALAFAMAFVLSLANVLAFAAPAPSARDGAHAAHATHADCAHRNHLGEGSSCCLGKTCACVHLCGDVLALDATFAAAAPQAAVARPQPPRAYATISARPLRPPIA